MWCERGDRGSPPPGTSQYICTGPLALCCRCWECGAQVVGWHWCVGCGGGGSVVCATGRPLPLPNEGVVGQQSGIVRWCVRRSSSHPGSMCSVTGGVSTANMHACAVTAQQCACCWAVHHKAAQAKQLVYTACLLGQLQSAVQGSCLQRPPAMGWCWYCCGDRAHHPCACGPTPNNPLNNMQAVTHHGVYVI